MCLADYQVARGIAGGRLRTMLRNNRPSRRRARARVATAALAGALFLALLGGCGDDGGGNGGQTTAPALTEASNAAGAATGKGASTAADEPDANPANDQTKIKTTITGVLSGSDPGEICGTLVTKRFVKKAYGDASGCKKAQSPKAAADKLVIGEIAISPEAVASTSVKAKGGIYGGERLMVDLVLQDGEWKLDSLRSNVPVGP